MPNFMRKTSRLDSTVLRNFDAGKSRPSSQSQSCTYQTNVWPIAMLRRDSISVKPEFTKNKQAAATVLSAKKQVFAQTSRRFKPSADGENAGCLTIANSAV
jgi:hypothetical protein